jgi:hypothetical protein
MRGRWAGHNKPRATLSAFSIWHRIMAAQPPTELMVTASDKISVATKSLAEILDSHEDAEDGATVIESDGVEDDAQEADVPPAEGYCIECEGVCTSTRLFQHAIESTTLCRPTCGGSLRKLW